jgi:hypothetical protein
VPLSGAGSGVHGRPTTSGPFAILKVRPEDATPSELFPGPGPTPNSVLFEPEDGANPQFVIATELAVRTPARAGQPAQSILNLKKVQVSVLVSDCRVALACNEYVKGGGWYPVFGGIAAGAIALTANAVTHARAKKQRRGNVMVGQVRYSWLSAVAFRERTGFTASLNDVRLVIDNPQKGDGTVGPSLILDIALPKRPTGAIAHDIVRRASIYRLTHDVGKMSESMRRRANELIAGPPLAPVPEKYTVYSLEGEPGLTGRETEASS